MPDYIHSVLKRFQHIKTKLTYPPYKPLCSYNQLGQITVQPDTSPPLSAPNKTKVKQTIGCLLYYARALDNKILVTLITIAQSQSNTQPKYLINYWIIVQLIPI